MRLRVGRVRQRRRLGGRDIRRHLRSAGAPRPAGAGHGKSRRRYQRFKSIGLRQLVGCGFLDDGSGLCAVRLRLIAAAMGERFPRQRRVRRNHVTAPQRGETLQRRRLAGDDDRGVVHLLHLHQIEQDGGILRRQPHATMRSRIAQMRDAGKAVNGVAMHVEEDGVRHRRVVPLLRVVVGVHAVGLECAARRVAARHSGRHRPDIKQLTVDRDRHGLGFLVDMDQDFGSRRPGKRHRNGPGEERGPEQHTRTHEFT